MRMISFLMILLLISIIIFTGFRIVDFRAKIERLNKEIKKEQELNKNLKLKVNEIFSFYNIDSLIKNFDGIHGKKNIESYNKNSILIIEDQSE